MQIVGDELNEKVAVLEEQVKNVRFSLKDHEERTEKALKKLDDRLANGVLQVTKIKWAVIGGVIILIASEVGITEMLKMGLKAVI